MSILGIGDLRSQEPGSAARYNTGKPELHLIPLSVIASWATLRRSRVEGAKADAVEALTVLGLFQDNREASDDTDRRLLILAMAALNAPWRDCAKVFAYGRQKYSAWNWLKGFPWSSVIDSCARHLLAMLEGEEIDSESGLSHAGHAMCNLVMLWTFVKSYPDGDDRLSSIFRASKAIKAAQ